MRFVITGEWTRNRLLVTIIWMFLLYCFLLWISSALLFFDRMSLDPADVKAYYCGDEATFRPARSYRALLEVTHGHLFAFGLLLLTLTHLCSSCRSRPPRSWRSSWCPSPRASPTRRPDG